MPKPPSTLEELLRGLPPPPQPAFADSDGNPRLSANADGNAASFLASIARQLQQAAALARTTEDAASLGLSELFQSNEEEDRFNDGSHRRRRAHKPEDALPSGLLIEELTLDDEDAARRQQGPSPAVAAVLAAATYGLPNFSIEKNLNGGSTAAAVMVDEPLGRPWVNPSTCAAAAELLSAVESKQLEQQRSETGRSAGPRLLAAAFPAALEALRPTAAAYAAHAATEASKLEPYEGPEAWERCIAASQLAALVLQVQTEDVAETSSSRGGNRSSSPHGRQRNESEVFSFFPLWNEWLRPTLLDVISDPSPMVQFYGLWALHHVITAVAPPTRPSIAAQMAQPIKKAMVACDERAWPAAAAAAAATASQLNGEEGSGKLSAAAVGLFEALLEEGERHSHSAPRAAVWLQQVPPLFAGFGVQLARYFGRLMFLLLGWCAALRGREGPPVRAAALHALHGLILAAWPRMPAHARVIWSVIDVAYVDETRHVAAQQAHQEVVAAAVAAAAALWRCSGDAFREEAMAGDVAVIEGDAVSLLQRVLKKVEAAGAASEQPRIQEL